MTDADLIAETNANMNQIGDKLSESKGKLGVIYSLISLLEKEDLRDDMRQKLTELKEQANACSDTIALCESCNIKPRTHSGGHARVFLCGLLQIAHCVIDILDCILRACKHIFDAICHLFHALKHTVMAGVESVKCLINTIKGKHEAYLCTREAEEAAAHQTASDDLMAQSAGDAEASAAAAVGPPPMPGVAAGLASSSAAAAAASAAEAALVPEHAMASNAAAAKAAENEKKANEHMAHMLENLAEAGKQMVEFGKSMWQAGMDLYVEIEHVLLIAAIMAWIIAVMSVPAVPMFPKPVSGWNPIFPYEWFPGAGAIEIFPEPVIELGAIVPVKEFIQGVNLTEKINKFIPDEEYIPPAIGFDGGGTVF